MCKLHPWFRFRVPHNTAMLDSHGMNLCKMAPRSAHSAAPVPEVSNPLPACLSSQSPVTSKAPDTDNKFRIF